METLAGMSMEPSGNLAAALQTMRPLPWGMSCLLFCSELRSEQRSEYSAKRVSERNSGQDQQVAALLQSLQA
jgi:hypothetical protein